jgi:hypothetical protein
MVKKRVVMFSGNYKPGMIKEGMDIMRLSESPKIAMYFDGLNVEHERNVTVGQALCRGSSPRGIIYVRPFFVSWLGITEITVSNMTSEALGMFILQ